MRIILFVLIAYFSIFSSAYAQIVMTPPTASGTMSHYYREHYLFCKSYIFYPYSSTIASDVGTTTTYDTSYETDNIQIGGYTSITDDFYFKNWGFGERILRRTTYKIWDHQGIIEFDLIGPGLPTEDMTASNFTARLNSLIVTNSSGSMSSGATLSINLYDLNDSAEDNAISLTDHNNLIDGAVSSGNFSFGTPLPYTLFNDVDVTAQLRRDLFGDGAGDPTTGFILICPEFDDVPGFVSIDNSTPAITITVEAPAEEGAPDDDSDTDNCFIHLIKIY